MKVLYEILVPTQYGFPEVKPIRTVHHKQWDKYVQSITGGLTIMKPAQGRWIDEGVEYPERIIPVRVMVEESFIPYDHAEPLGAGRRDNSQIEKIINFTLSHYRQKAVMYYIVSSRVIISYNTDLKV
jgi:hypothetical protein